MEKTRESRNIIIGGLQTVMEEVRLSTGELKEIEKPIPYLPEKVVQNTMRFLSTSKVAACRLVSKKWNKSCCAILNHRVTIQVDSLTDVTEYNKAFSNSMDGISLRINQIIFSHKIFNEIMRMMKGGRQEEIISTVAGALQKLSEKMKEHVRALTVTFQVEASPWLAMPLTMKGVHSILYDIIFEHFPNVEELVFSVSVLHLEEYPVEDDSSLGQNEKEEESHRPLSINLRKLTIHTVTISEWIGVSELRSFLNLTTALVKSARNLETLQCSPKIINLIGKGISEMLPFIKILHIRESVEASDLRSLAKYTFANSLSLKVDCTWNGSYDDLDDVHLFLERFAHIITEFRSTMKTYSETVLFTFPPPGLNLSVLERLTLLSFRGTIFWKNMPQLKQLQFKNVAIRSSRLYPSTLPEKWSLTNFSYEAETETSTQLEKVYITVLSPVVPIWFSGLASLTLRICNVDVNMSTLLTQIFQRCSKLRTLHVEDLVGISNGNGICLDECIIGIAEGLETLKSVCDECIVNDVALTGLISIARAEERAIPNIGSLADLKDLVLKGIFSDVAVLFGVLLCTKLKTLQLQSKVLTANSLRICRNGLQDLERLNIS